MSRKSGFGDIIFFLSLSISELSKQLRNFEYVLFSSYFYREVVENYITYKGLFSNYGCKRLNKKIQAMAIGDDDDDDDVTE